MNHRIGGSAADVSVLLDRLAGSERPGRAQAFSKVVMAAGRSLYVLLAVVVTAFIALIVILARQGLLTWE